jgi:hypothetical protein
MGRTGQSIQAGYDQCVARLDGFQHFFKLWPLSVKPGQFLLKYLVTAFGLKVFNLGL